MELTKDSVLRLRVLYKIYIIYLFIYLFIYLVPVGFK